MNDAKLWKAFSEFIRLRDSDEKGYCSCFTCGAIRFWKNMDCGHGIPRQYKYSKYNEKNNHAQCKPCNGFNGGRQDLYKQKVNERYGPGTWELMDAFKRKVTKWSQFDIDQMTKFYREAARKLKIQKGLPE